MTEPLNFQSIIMALQDFWAGKGCLIWQPYYTQVGAGTMNPGTYLRVLGPEPWNVGYVEPSIRPDDARYGENPNRMQMHYQYQVILKPDPGNPQDLYLQSLEALGIDPVRHDIRFVEDNWEQPALGAWGLGWEVWLDGQEITQFTYFQQAGGINLDPVSVELTYGLERIAISLQRVAGFTDINWNDALTDGDVNLQAEQEHSKYYFETADINRLRKMYELFNAEAEACLDQGLVLPAYDYILKCSHTFNVLDTRGAVGVTDRQALFGRMRELSRRVSEAYLAQRESMGFPWLDRVQPVAAANKQEEIFDNGRQPQTEAGFLLEIGTEEIPNLDLKGALGQLEEKVPGWLEQQRLAHGEIRIFGTPRRLVVHVDDLASRQPVLEETVKGPPAERAFGEDGAPTKAAVGFAKSKGISVDDLQVMETDGGRYVSATVKQAGMEAFEVLGESLPDLLRSLRFSKTMRWNSSNTAFSRPIRWLLALHGETVVPFEYAGLQSGRTTRGLRFKTPAEITLDNPSQYFKELAEQGILIDSQERRKRIFAQANQLAEKVECRLDTDPRLLDEVTNLVEAPAALRGTFDRSHLALPRQVLTSVMKKHQRYFPVYEKSSQGEGKALAPYFIAVRNGDEQGGEEVIEGNEHVIRARFADAHFFVEDDLKQPLEAFLPKLGTMTFQVKLGSMLDKTGRITTLVGELGKQIEMDGQESSWAERAAELCKADLATSMVVEMTSLQGYMGSYYAAQSGEEPEVCSAIFEHYLPRYAGDQFPASKAGLVVGIADRLDSLVGLFAAGLAPTGNKDPFALRRAALGMLQNIIEWELDFDLSAGVNQAAGCQPVEVEEAERGAVLEFITERLRNLLLEGGARFDVVDAVLVELGDNPVSAARAVNELGEWVQREDWEKILPAYSRCVRITRDLEKRYPFNPDLAVEEAEQGLYQSLLKAEAAGITPGSVDGFLNAFLPMIPSVNRFFDDVLVMVEEDDIRENRLGLLQRVAALAAGAADMSRLEGF